MMVSELDYATQLVWDYYHRIEHTISDEYADSDYQIAKMCATIGIDHRLKEIEDWLSINKDTEVLSLWNYQVGQQRYFHKVKEEIEKL